MTYIATDRQGGTPIELHTFSTTGDFWRYTSADEDKNFQLIDYEKIIIKRGKIKTSDKISKNTIIINVDLNAEFLDLFRGAPPAKQIMYNLVAYYENDPDLEPYPLFNGIVTNVKFLENIAEVTCSSIASATRNLSNIRKFATSCPYMLYETDCGVTSASYRVDSNVIAVNGNDLVLSNISQDDRYFSGGFVEWDDGSIFQQRFILSQINNVFDLDLPFSGITGGADVRVYPGCDKLLSTCDEKFNNSINYGGQPFYPEKNPMAGVNVFE